MGQGLSNSLTEEPFADLTDVTLADKDTNSIPTNTAKRAFQGNAHCIAQCVHCTVGFPCSKKSPVVATGE